MYNDNNLPDVTADNMFAKALGSDCQLNRILKTIKEDAKDNKVMLNWSFGEVAKEVYQSVIDKLEALGFYVFEDTYESTEESINAFFYKNYCKNVFICWDPNVKKYLENYSK